MQKLTSLNFDVLDEEISSSNVLPIAECIAFAELRFMTTITCGKLRFMLADLCEDISRKNSPKYALSDSYDLVQTVALFLCDHFGKHLDDVMFYNKKGKKITLHILCCRQVIKEIDKRTSAFKRNIRLDVLNPENEPYIEIKADDDNQDYTICDKIIDSLNLTENMRIALECRMSGLSYPQIARLLGRVQATVYEYFIKMRQRYTAIYG